jgi:hypothetical protein
MPCVTDRLQVCLQDTYIQLLRDGERLQPRYDSLSLVRAEPQN